MLPIEHIQRISKNRGGIKRVDLIFEKDIAAMPVHDPASLYLSGSLSLLAGAQAHAIHFTKTSLNYRETAVTNHVQGDFYRLRLTGRTPQDRSLLRHLRQRLMNNRVALVFQDHNNYWRIYRRMRCRPDTGSGNFGGYNGSTLNFTGQSILPAGFWEFTLGVIPTVSPTCPDYIPEQYIIGDPNTGDMIGDPNSNTVIGWQI